MTKISPKLRFKFEKNFTKISPKLKDFLRVPVVTPRPDYFSSKFDEKSEEEKSFEVILITNLEIEKIGEKQFKCPICEFISRTKYVYRSCESCDKSFSIVGFLLHELG